MEAVLLESQRLQHVVPTAGPRRVLKDTTLDGYNIPKVHFTASCFAKIGLRVKKVD